MNIPDSSIMLIETHAHSFDYYLGYVHKTAQIETFERVYAANNDKYFINNKKDKDSLQSNGYRVEAIISQPDYNVARIKLKFLNPATRASKLDSLFLVKIYTLQ